ncbi:MAG: O-antigen ligase family protein [Methylophilaceae bacterium]|nr:MAG: O-antigen ligase family protein [Methylophilaceae bacterium]
MMQTTISIFSSFMGYLPWILPLLLLFSRAGADITVLCIGVAFLFKSYQSKDWEWTKQTWFKLNLLFWLYLLCINAPLSIDSADSFMHAILYLRWPLFAAALAYWLLNNQKFQQHFLIALMVICAFILLDTSLQYITGTDLFGHTKPSPTRLTGPYSRPIPGIMMLRVLFIVLLITVVSPLFRAATRRIFVTLSVLCIGLLFMFITGERMALLLFFTGSIVVLVGLVLDQKMHKTKVLSGFAFILAFFAFTISFNPEMAERSIYSTVSKLIQFMDSDYGLVFRAAIAAWQENPIFGSGFHTYRSACEQLGLLPLWGIPCSHPHNLYLQIGAETGVIGLLLFISIVVSIYFSALSQPIKTKQWFISCLSFTILSVSFWPLIGGISILNNGVAALVWLGVGWALSVSTTKISKP